MALEKRFPSPDGGEVSVLDRLDLTVHPGEFVCLLGPSGCGKTTLLNIIAGFESPSAGSVYMDDALVKGPAPERGVVFQEYAVFPWLSVRENIAFGLRVKRTSREVVDEAVRQYVELMGLSGFEEYLPGQISGGMRQRVAIARVLANQPRVMLMDEPFAALDAQTRLLLQKELVRVWSVERLTVIFVTHNIEEAILLGDRVIVMSKGPGRIRDDVEVSLPRPRDIAGDDFNEYRRQLLRLIESH